MKIELEPEDISRLASEITLSVAERLKSSLASFVPADDAVFTVEGLAKYLKTTPKWVYNHLPDLPKFKMDGLLRFRKAVIDSFFEQNPSKMPKV